MKYVLLVGDYLKSPQRQRQAKELGCDLVFDIHFNSNGADAKGAEVWRKPDDSQSLTVAQAILRGYENLGLPIHGSGIKEAVRGTRPSWIRHYEMPAVELEPLFVTNPTEARWIHREENMDALAAMLAKVALTHLPEDATLGLSIGHLFKSPTSTDKGAKCVLGDYEADHCSVLAHKIANIVADEIEDASHHELEDMLAPPDPPAPPGNVDVTKPDRERVAALWSILCFVVNDLDAARPEATKQNIRRFMTQVAWHEGARIKERSQVPSGPGRSFFQMEAPAAKDGLDWANQNGWIGKLSSAAGKTDQQIIDGLRALTSSSWPSTNTTIEQCLLNSDLFSAYLARIKLKRDSAAIPADNAGHTSYWAGHWKIVFANPEQKERQMKQFRTGADEVDQLTPSGCS